MKIKIYLEDNVDWDILKKKLENKGFKVISAKVVKNSGKSKEIHLACAISNNAILLTNNKEFYNISLATKHKGILITHTFTDPKKKVTIDKIIRGLENIREQMINRGFSLENKTPFPLNLFF